MEQMFCGDNVEGKLVCCYGRLLEVDERDPNSGFFIRTGNVPKDLWQKQAGVYPLWEDK